MRDPAFPTFCALGIILCLLPLPWHWKARNTGTLLYIGWVSLGCTNMLINSLVWDGNTKDVAPVWCNISINISMMLGISIMCSSLCIQRRLYSIATLKHASYTPQSKRRDMIADLIIGIGIPALYIPLAYVTRSNKYDIVEDFGCWPTFYNTLLAIPTITLWPVVISLASCIYGVLTVRAFFKTRRQFSQVLSDSASGLTMSHYFRLMALALTDALFFFPASIFMLLSDLGKDDIMPWISWEYTHHDFNSVGVSTFEELNDLEPLNRLGLDLTRWLTPGAAVLFFALFGMSREATDEYKRLLRLLLTRLGIQRPEPESPPNRWSSRLASAVSSGFPVSFASRSPADIEFTMRDRSELHTTDQNVTNNIESQLSQR